MLGRDHRLVTGAQAPLGLVHPPRVAEPQRRQHVHRGGFGAAIGDRDPHVDVVGCRLGVFDVDVGVAIVVEHPGVEQLVLHLQPAALGVGGDEVAVRELPQRVPVTALQVGGGGRGVEEEVVLLDVLAVVALGVGQTEHPLLEDGVDAVPHGERQAEALVIVGDAGDAVLAPLVGARPRLIVAEVAPRVTVGAVVLAHGAPLPLAEVRAPRLPWHAAACLVQASCFLSRPHRCASRRLGRGDAEATTPPGDSAIESDAVPTVRPEPPIEPVLWVDWRRGRSAARVSTFR